MLKYCKMGAAGSVRRVMRAEVTKLREKELNREEEFEKKQGEEWVKAEASVGQLLSEKHDLAEQLRSTRECLKVQSEGWQREKSKAMALMFSELPLEMINSTSTDMSDGPVDASLSKMFPMVTLAQCDVAGFASLTTRLHPQEAVRVIDHLHALIDETFTDKNIFLMERTSDGCIAASGLVESYPEPRHSVTSSQLSVTDSSYGSEVDLELDQTRKPESRCSLTPPFTKAYTNVPTQETAAEPLSTPDLYASVLATAALHLMSASTQIEIPRLKNKQLQLRIALHAGPCSAGVIGLQTGAGASRIPHYKLFGPSLKYVHNLCSTGLALQIRVSKQCQELLARTGMFKFERCPDYNMWSVKKPIESFWLVGKEGLDLKLPSLDNAILLTEYDDIEI